MPTSLAQPIARSIIARLRGSPLAAVLPAPMVVAMFAPTCGPLLRPEVTRAVEAFLRQPGLPSAPLEAVITCPECGGAGHPRADTPIAPFCRTCGGIGVIGKS
jgi:hypothetical protein